MLAQQLREMERDGLIIRTDLSGRLRHVEYSLSDSGGFAVLQAHQHFDRVGLAICSIAPQARSYLQLVRVNSFWIARLRVFLSWVRESSTGLALKQFCEDACVLELLAQYSALQACASPGLSPSRKVLYLRLVTILRNQRISIRSANPARERPGRSVISYRL